MKPNMQRKGNIAEAPSRHVVKTSKLKMGTNRQRGPGQKASVLPFSTTEVLSGQLSESDPSIESRKEVASLELKSRQVDPLTKIKLQLFPVDEVTRIGLEKDGLNPFLELTLRARKKISSVVKHIHTKWGSSSLAVGEPMLLPYDARLRHPATNRWTLKDTATSAADVYKAVESPAVFRLSYGWFSDLEPQSEVSAATASHSCMEPESMQIQIQNTEERKDQDATSEATVTEQDTQVKMGQSHEQEDDITNLSMGGLLSEASGPEKNGILQPVFLSTDISIGGLLSEASLQEKLRNDQIRWDDSLTALSIGGLLSEASLQAKINSKSDPKFSEFVSDSFDAMISSQVKSNPRSSILDAEETCQAFSFHKFASSTKNVRVSARGSQDLSLSSFPHLLQVDKQAEDPSPSPEPKMELFPSEDSRLRAITWNESSDPFNLGISMPWKE